MTLAKEKSLFTLCYFLVFLLSVNFAQIPSCILQTKTQLSTVTGYMYKRHRHIFNKHFSSLLYPHMGNILAPMREEHEDLVEKSNSFINENTNCFIMLLYSTYY